MSGSESLGFAAFNVCEVEILTTVGSSLSARSAKESGAGRARAGAVARVRATTKNALKVRNIERFALPESGPAYAMGIRNK